ncbi:transporter substrate-binding domain-containing protein [Salinicola corii]|uniref:Transporter substrate-binding domain-containing protein n=1 Tax=Salinicola corii TaxID=2606937 RepID=A0A640WD32_9GAMM|nr:transporter substrate-binding domain-containing protein [Salinicola corii]KAA0017255.1 transporter substrate-binding domain-containing protein [Salinicola corii]
MFAFAKNRFSRQLVLALCCTVAAGLAAVAVQASDLDTIEQRGTLRVAVPQDFPPFGSVGTDLQPQGYDVDMAQYLADQMELDLQLVTVTSANRIPFLQTDKVDLVISSLGKNPERAAVIDFTEAYAPFFLGVFGTPDAARIDDAAGLSGKTVGVTRGSVEDMELSDLAPDDATIQRFEDNATTISAFLSGQVDYIATGNVVAAQIAERNAERAPTMVFRIKNSPCYIGLTQDNTVLKTRVNELIEQGKEDGTLESMSQKWFHTALPDDL